MKSILHPPRVFSFAAVCAAVVVIGCGTEEPPPAGPAKKVSLGSNLTLEVQGEQRRVLLDAVVTEHGEGLQYFEFFLTIKRKDGKGYESILEADVDARKLQQALLTAKAVPGKPYRSDPYRPPSGQTIKILLRYEKDGKQVTDTAQSWVRSKSGEDVKLDWVFTGSQFFEDEDRPGRPKIFLAEAEGSLITVVNLEGTLIDINIRNSKSITENELTYNTERIPPPGTKVTVILEPVGEYHPGKK